VAEGRIGRRLGEALAPDPQIELVDPPFGPARVAVALAKQEALHPVHGLASIVFQVLTDPDQIAKRLFLGRRHADSGELSRPVQTRQVASIQAIGLHPSSRPARDEVDAMTSQGTPRDLRRRCVS
jgi:hypothetical protein